MEMSEKTGGHGKGISTGKGMEAGNGTEKRDENPTGTTTIGEEDTAMKLF